MPRQVKSLSHSEEKSVGGSKFPQSQALIELKGFNVMFVS